jgi:hypothetical protein
LLALGGKGQKLQMQEFAFAKNWYLPQRFGIRPHIHRASPM